MPRYKRISPSIVLARAELPEMAKARALSYLFGFLAIDTTKERMKLPLTIKLTYEQDLWDGRFVAEIEDSENEEAQAQT